MVGVYKIENKITGKVYIGQSVDIKSRWRMHQRELDNGTHDNVFLQIDWNRYGADSFTFDVIKKCRSNKLNEIERYFIHKYNSDNRDCGYNRTRGNGNTLELDEPYLIICKTDNIHPLCADCGYNCKQSEKNDIIMCKHIAESL